MKKIDKFGVITRPSTYIGWNNIATFFFEPLPKCQYLILMSLFEVVDLTFII